MVTVAKKGIKAVILITEIVVAFCIAIYMGSLIDAMVIWCAYRWPN